MLNTEETVALAKASYLRGQFDLAETMLKLAKDGTLNLHPELQAVLERIVKTPPPPLMEAAK